MKNTQRVHEVEAGRPKRRLTEVRLHEITWISLGSDVDGRTQVDTHDMRAGSACEMKPATHSTACVYNSEPAQIRGAGPRNTIRIFSLWTA